MLTISLDSDHSEPSYLGYHVESDPSESSYPSVIRLTSDSSSSSAVPRHASPPVRGRGLFVPALCPIDMGVLEEKDVAMLLPMVLGIVSSHPTGDVVITYGAEHEDSPFCL